MNGTDSSPHEANKNVIDIESLEQRVEKMSEQERVDFVLETRRRHQADDPNDPVSDDDLRLAVLCLRANRTMARGKGGAKKKSAPANFTLDDL